MSRCHSKKVTAIVNEGNWYALLKRMVLVDQECSLLQSDFEL
jgi:hypothetical protein